MAEMLARLRRRSVAFPRANHGGNCNRVSKVSVSLVAALAVDDGFEPFIDERRFDTLGQGSDIGRHLVFGNHHKANAQLIERIERLAINIGPVNHQVHNAAVWRQIRLRLLNEVKQIRRFIVLNLHNAEGQGDQRDQINEGDEPPTIHQFDDFDFDALLIAFLA